VPYCQGTGSIAPGTPGWSVNKQIPDWNNLVHAGAQVRSRTRIVIILWTPYGQKIKTAAKMTVVQASTMEQLSAPFPTAPHGSA
jgi:2,4-dienoyl-CoA reductase-like NADH-dependent reductase (Old Yellow Enzyme family)